ncbi:hypothetical protein [Bacillus benzoevorans]|uniref:Uncharacterized protein n=1 Tax=Bacillus benzoevorans TaxID=1456 RepID=A0A7X0HQQ5_9BACI|nr:hypothetical protein [Bacillus benzoevorans]
MNKKTVSFKNAVIFFHNHINKTGGCLDFSKDFELGDGQDVLVRLDIRMWRSEREKNRAQIRRSEFDQVKGAYVWLGF